MAIIAVAVIALLVPIVGFNLQTETNEVNRASLSEDALAAAQAGINDYRTFIDSNPAYYAFTCGRPHANLAMGTGAPTYACNTWEPVSGTNNEWFHYVPDDSQLARAAANSGSPHEMLLEVTGRAGAAGDYTYRTILAGYTLSGILTDSYYSNYELTDPGQPNAYADATLTPKGKPAQSLPLSNIQVQYAELTTSGTYQYFGPESLLTALCVYHTYNENTFIDSLGTVTNQWVTSGGGHPIASSNEPYYGPFYDLLSSLPGGALTINIPNTLPNSVVPVNAGATIVINTGVMACAEGGQGIYNSSVTFNGIAYTNDQLAFCGSGPTFTGSPPLESGAPSAVPYGDDWPGSQLETVKGVMGYYPKGYTYDFEQCGAAAPNYGGTASPHAVKLDSNQTLPPTVSGLAPFADGGTPGFVGCLFTGPTMIQFIAGGLMNVWSPLTENTNPGAALLGLPTQNCGTYSPGQPYQAGIPVPQDSNGSGGVILVQNEQSPVPVAGGPSPVPNSDYPAGTPACTAAAPLGVAGVGCTPPIVSVPCATYSPLSPPPSWEVNVNVCVPNGALPYASDGAALNPAVAAAGGNAGVKAATCIDPYLYNYLSGGVETDPGTAPATSLNCTQGDAIVEGELEGLLTLSASNDIIVSRDLTYDCSDAGGAASNVNPASVAACNSAGTNDELALVPQNELVVPMPLNEPYNSNCTTAACGTKAAPVCPDDGTEVVQTMANVVPWSCVVDTTFTGGMGGNGIVIDAAAVDLTGSTIAQNFAIAQTPGGTSANLYQNGTNINNFAGLNGTTGGQGYNQIITYDQRLSYENPPGLLQATNTVWNVSTFVVCGTVDTSKFAVTNAGTNLASQALNCPNQA
jgi:type II secretory pathway pseudopilin PulG